LVAAFWGRDSLFQWALHTHPRHRREFPKLLDASRTVRLGSARQAEQWLSTLVSGPSRRDRSDRHSEYTF
jgi:hypothetical protein